MIQFNVPTGSQGLPSVSLSQHTEHTVYLGGAQPSAQVLTLLEFDEDYAALYKQCQQDVLAFKTIKELVELGRGGKGYAEERSSFRGMSPRSLKYKLMMDLELRDFLFFLLHVGPKPILRKENALTLDRINTWKGYVVGNLAWSDKAQQTANRKTTRHHLVNGVKLTHAELARLLTKESGLVVPVERVKKRHQRGDSTEKQFAMEGVPYASGLSPRHCWCFPTNADAIAAKYQTSRRRGETRIDFYERTLRERIYSLRARIASPKHSGDLQEKKQAEAQMDEYSNALLQVQKTLKAYDLMEFKEDLVPLLQPSANVLAFTTLHPAAAEPQACVQHVPFVEAEPGCGYSKETIEQLLKEFKEATDRVEAMMPKSPPLPLAVLLEAIADLPPEDQAALREVSGRHLNRLLFLAGKWAEQPCADGAVCN